MASEKKKNSRMCGYLEKRGKWTITGTWKKWWCVLEGQLLLYYKSRTHYLRLAPCSGSLNVALVKSVIPQTHRQIHVITHSQIIILRASSKEKQQNWFLAFMNVLPRRCDSSYEVQLGDNMPYILQQTDHTTKVYEQCDYCENSLGEFDDKAHRERDSNADFREKREAELEEKSQFQREQMKSLSRGSECNRSRSDTINRHEKPAATDEKRSSSYHNLENSVDGTRPKIRMPRMKRFHSIQCITNFTDENFVIPSTEKCFSYRSSLVLAKSHEQVHCKPSQSYVTEEYEFHFEKHTESCPRKNPAGHKIERKESFSFLRRVLTKHHTQKDLIEHEYKQTVTEKDGEQTVVTRTMQDYLKNRNNDLREVEEETHSTVARKTKEPHKGQENQQSSCSERLSRSETNASIRNSERVSRRFPPNTKENAQIDVLPMLPAKKTVNSKKYSSKIAELSAGAYGSIGRGSKTTFKHSDTDLDSLLFQLNLLTGEELIKHESSEQRSNVDNKEDPDYDIPIPHASLIDRSFSERISQCGTDTTAQDDLPHNSRSETLSSLSITPDSLETPWMFDSKQVNRWSTPDYTFDTLNLNNQSESNNDAFLDLLHPPLRL